MTNIKSNLRQLARQGDSKAITTLMNEFLQLKNVTVKVALTEGCLQIMLESVQIPEKQALLPLVQKSIASLEITLIERVKVYGKLVGEEFPAWSQEFELAGLISQSKVFHNTFENSKPEGKQLQTLLVHEVLDQFMILKARTSIGISYIDLPPVLGMAKLAVQKFERSPDCKVCTYLTELINEIMFYYELSLECLSYKVKCVSLSSAVFIGFSGFSGIPANEKLGRTIKSHFPDIPRSVVTGFYEFDTALYLIWVKAGELTDELDDILNKPIDLNTLTSKKCLIETVAPDNTNNKTFAGIIAILLGCLGLHKFILGYPKEGVIMLLISIFGFGFGASVMFIVGLIEGIIYLTKSNQDFVNTYITGKKGWF